MRRSVAMPTFIDESSDTGHGHGSKPYFRLGAIWLPTLAEAEAFRKAIRKLRQRLGLPLDYEFKFAETHRHPEWRQAFFNTALDFPFRFTVCAIDKTTGRWRKANSREQHWAAATSIASCLYAVYLEAEKVAHPLRDLVVVDRNDDKKFLDAIRTALRGLQSRFHPGIPLTQNPRFRASHPDEVIQLVDMVCGATGAHLAGDVTWYKMIERCCIGLMRIP
jgi:Protein of unknown function (DUF3800)